MRLDNTPHNRTWKGRTSSALNVAAGLFSQIATTDPVFLGLTSGPGGKIYGADINSGHLLTISSSGATTQYGSVTAPNGFFGLAYSRLAGKFFADDLSPTNVNLYSITGDGNSSSFVGQIAGPNSGFFPLATSFSGPAVTCILTSQLTWLMLANRHSHSSILPPAR